MKGSGGSFSGLLLRDPLSPEPLVLLGAALDGMWVSKISLVMKPLASGEELAPLSSLSLLGALGLGGDRRREDQSRHEQKNPVKTQKNNGD